MDPILRFDQSGPGEAGYFTTNPDSFKVLEDKVLGSYFNVEAERYDAESGTFVPTGQRLSGTALKAQMRVDLGNTLSGRMQERYAKKFGIKDLSQLPDDLVAEANKEALETIDLWADYVDAQYNFYLANGGTSGDNFIEATDTNQDEIDTYMDLFNNMHKGEVPQ
jgi:hypothetical protein